MKAELAKVLEAWEWRGTVDELMAYWLTTGTEIDQDVLAYVTSLHNQGIPCFMATDQERYRGEFLEERFGDDPKNIDVAKAYGMDGYLYTGLDTLKAFLS